MNTSKLKSELTKNKTIKHFIYFDSVSSTNDYAKENYKKLKHGAVILADEQTNGRGRFENKWFSPKGKGLYFSILLKGTTCGAPTIELLNLIPAYAVLKAIKEKRCLSPFSLQLKYPNDILINNKKVGGILVETKYTGKKLEYAVIGVGLNIIGKPSDFPFEIRKTSAFISQFIKKVGAPHVVPLLINIIKNLDKLYACG